MSTEAQKLKFQCTVHPQSVPLQILHKKNGPTPEIEEGASYILKNCILSIRHGQLFVLVGRTSSSSGRVGRCRESCPRCPLSTITFCHLRGGGPIFELLSVLHVCLFYFVFIIRNTHTHTHTY